jgi:hypothetical protein
MKRLSVILAPVLITGLLCVAAAHAVAAHNSTLKGFQTATSDSDGIVGDILVTQGSPGLISRVRWDGTQFAIDALAEAGEFKQAAFSPA